MNIPTVYIILLTKNDSRISGAPCISQVSKEYRWSSGIDNRGYTISYVHITFGRSTSILNSTSKSIISIH